MTRLLEDKTAVVTGAASGSGRATAITFAKHGADVVVADIRDEPRKNVTPTKKYIEQNTDATCRFVTCDVANEEDVEKSIRYAQELGGIDIMVNNAGVSGPEKSFLETDETEIDEVLSVNLHGVINGCRLAAMAMKKNGSGGSIVNVSSIGGIVGVHNGSAYSASKGGVRTLTYSLAAELAAHNIRVNAIHPGVIRTAMAEKDGRMIDEDRLTSLFDHDFSLKDLVVSSVRGEFVKRNAIPMGEFGTPEDVANAATFLSSEMSSYITGESLAVDGGMLNTGLIGGGDE